MTQYRDAVLSALMWTWGGTVYFLMEVAYKIVMGRPEAISWTMLVLAMVLCVPIEVCGAELPWKVPLWAQALLCAVIVTATEFFCGILLNIVLDLGIWDYSNLPGNVLGQICPQFFVLWFVLCLVFIPVFDWIRYIVVGGERPRYYFLPQFK